LFSPPFNQSIDSPEYVNLIKRSNAHLVFVALGCPKQEIWMAKNYRHLNSVLLGVGGAFPVFAGVAKRAPQFMQNYSLEWLYRLGQEPGRLFGRYLKTNSKFLFLLAKMRIRKFFQ
jgi:N-acetylglucosaminyldiphosphoundecaprenol N-acetyl-beta-D-mannosaminyltransferase